MKLIESRFGTANAKSPPARGAWIETLIALRQMASELVAPRAGGVD